MSHQMAIGLFVVAVFGLASLRADEIRQLFKKFAVCAGSWQPESNFSAQRYHSRCPTANFFFDRIIANHQVQANQLELVRGNFSIDNGVSKIVSRFLELHIDLVGMLNKALEHI